MRLSMRILPLAASVFLLAACDEAADFAASGKNFAPPPPAPSPVAADVDSFGGLAESNVRRGAIGQDGGVRPDVGAMLAYSYDAQLVAPSGAIKSLMDGHLAACDSAGFATCQLLNSSFNDDDSNQVYGSIYVRAAPGWLAQFRINLEADAQSAGGKLRRQGVNVEDLTTQIVDVEARLNAKRTLRDRLQNLLERQSGDVGDLLEVERELARVIADLDASQAQLAAMRQRVDMSTMSVSYYSKSTVESGSVFAPLGAAIRDFVGILVFAVAVIIRTTAFLIPFAAILTPLIWWLARQWRKRRARRRAAAA